MSKIDIDFKSKYHRVTPIKEFDLNQTLYSLVKKENINNKNSQAIGYLGFNKTYGELFNEVEKLADAYTKAGVNYGDTVAICTINTPAVQQNLLALNKIGVVSKWIDLRTKGNDLIKNINESECKIVVIFDEIAPLFEQIINETNVEKVLMSSPKDYLPAPIKILANYKDKKNGKFIKTPNDKRFLRFTDFMETGSKNNKWIQAPFEKDKPSLIIQSSGSTGKPKSIIHSDYNLNSSVQKFAYTDLPFYKGKVLYVSVPPFIIYGLSNSIYAALAFQMKAEMTPYVAENTVYDDLGKFDISFGAPLHYRYIMAKIKELTSKIPELEKENDQISKKELKRTLIELERIFKGLKRTDILVSGGDKMSAEEILEMQLLFDKVIINGYGNNEVVGAAVVSPRYANKPGSIGVPLYGIEAAVFDPETNQKLNQGELGELCLQIDNPFLEYDNNPEETEKIKREHEDGKYWIHTGDLCYIDEDGYITPKGRSRRIIIKDCFKICPDTIENVIQEMPFVKNCIVIGVDDEKLTSVPMAFIELEKEYKDQFDILLTQIEAYCQKKLPDYEIPSYFKEIEKIPYTSNNKQDFKLLEELGNEYVKANSPKKLIKVK
ncbi:MAG: class I adenylate-forming enzyme family protein [Bacilli bacterium]|nr:class I adenylate-forming enzyme family protein [Bacilli bacterium]